jgi:hypothetical protein
MALARALADRYTAVPYDLRGNSRSVVDGAVKDLHLDLFGEDAARLLAELEPGALAAARFGVGAGVLYL